MSASANEKGPQKVRFFDWLVSQIDSGAYEGLYWLDKNSTFRIPWKHSSRKNLAPRDYRIFKEWAAVGGKYEKGSSNPTKWKTNFRNALKSTNRFELLSAVQDPNPHRVYKIIPLNKTPDIVPPVNKNHGSDPDDDPLHISPHGEGLPVLHQPAPLPQQEIEVSFGTLSLGNPGPVQNGNSWYPYSGDTLDWVCQQSKLNLGEVQQVSWAPAQVEDTDNPFGETPYNDDYFIENVFMNEEPLGNTVMMNNTAQNDHQMPANQQAIIEPNLLAPPAVPCLAEPPLLNTAPLQNGEGADLSHLEASIYYRGKLVHETEVKVNGCMFTYNKYHPCDPAFGNLQIVQFPNPEKLPDQKQVKHTLTLLENAGLLLYEKNHKICAKRLDRCKVYWAFSKQLDTIAPHSQFKCLLRDTESEIFDYTQFWQELKDFHEKRRSQSPDYTLYLCFGECWSAAKPKESKLILVKLVPKHCREWHETVLREGSSSLSSDTMSLQISNSLMDLIELMDFC